MEIFNPAHITHIHQDKDAFTLMFADGHRVLFTGVEVHPVIPEFILLKQSYLLWEFDS